MSGSEFLPHGRQQGSLLLVPERVEDTRAAGHVLRTWVLWLPVAGVCFYVAWGYRFSGLEMLLVIPGTAAIVRLLVTTRRWRKKVARERWG